MSYLSFALENYIIKMSLYMICLSVISLLLAERRFCFVREILSAKSYEKELLELPLAAVTWSKHFLCDFNSLSHHWGILGNFSLHGCFSSYLHLRPALLRSHNSISIRLRFMVDSMFGLMPFIIVRSCGTKTNPNQHPSTTVL